MSAERPPIAITLGDPNGIGPEVILRALAAPELAAPEFSGGDTFRIYGAPGDLRAAYEILAPRCGPALFDPTAALAGSDPRLSIVPVPSDPDAGPLRPGDFDSRRVAVQRRSLVEAARDAMAGRVGAVVTGPINKAIFARPEGGPPLFPGQSELFVAETGAADWAMMLAGERLRVVLVTTHLPLREVAAALSVEGIRRKGEVAVRALRDGFGVDAPRLAVAALNPHAGDGGLLGDEEERLIAPAVAELRSAGHDVTGPLPADTLFAKAVDGAFDAVLVMYHDQGLIPLKLVDFGRAVNVTLGLPIVRTSPDHGVAYDIAGQGRADAGGMRAAIRLAARMSRRPSPPRGETARSGRDEPEDAD